MLTSEPREHYHQSFSNVFHKCIISAITTLTGLLQLGYGEAAAVSLFSTEYVMVVVFTVAVLVFIGSLAVKILQARENPDLSEFMDKISLSSGTLAVTLELLIMVPALGWFAFASMEHYCNVIAVTKSYHEIAVVFKRLYQRELEQLDKLKELFMNIGASALFSNAFNRLERALRGQEC
ncbi:unnamed protein product [Malus baccata var. baccata]